MRPADGRIPERQRISRLERALLLSFAAIALALAYWSVLRAPNILARDDNPRLVESELRIRRGRILDTSGEVLAETFGPDENLVRVYPEAGGGPAVGYYSLRHGTAGIESGYDALLRGTTDDFWSGFWRHEVLHQTPEGRDVRLTLDSDWQREAEMLLGESQGAALLLSVPDLAIRAMVSHPTYDPNQLDEQFEQLSADERAPLLNRVTQGQYQPGLVLQPFILAAALDLGLLTLNDAVGSSEYAGRPVEIGGHYQGCQEQPPQGATWAVALASRCPAPMLDLARSMTKAELVRIFEQFGFTSVPELSIAAEASDADSISDLELALLGQEELTVSPLQVALALVSLANGGQLSQANLVMGVEDQQGGFLPRLVEDSSVGAVGASSARSVLAALPVHEGIGEYATLAYSASVDEANAWYLGLAPNVSPRYAVVVIVEEVGDVASAERIGRALLDHVLSNRSG